jgi:hypothetical protein
MSETTLTGIPISDCHLDSIRTSDQTIYITTAELVVEGLCKKTKSGADGAWLYAKILRICSKLNNHYQFLRTLFLQMLSHQPAKL